MFETQTQEILFPKIARKSEMGSMGLSLPLLPLGEKLIFVDFNALSWNLYFHSLPPQVNKYKRSYLLLSLRIETQLVTLWTSREPQPPLIPFSSPSRGDRCPEFGIYHFCACFCTFVTHACICHQYILLLFVFDICKCMCSSNTDMVLLCIHFYNGAILYATFCQLPFFSSALYFGNFFFYVRPCNSY
jgi:hypothetical protein